MTDKNLLTRLDQWASSAGLRDHRLGAETAAADMKAAAARIRELEAALSEMTRRRDEWCKKAGGYDALAAAVRAGIDEVGDRNLSRIFLRGALVDSERRLEIAEAEVARLRAGLDATLADRAQLIAWMLDTLRKQNERLRARAEDKDYGC